MSLTESLCVPCLLSAFMVPTKIFCTAALSDRWLPAAIGLTSSPFTMQICFGEHGRDVHKALDLFIMVILATDFGTYDHEARSNGVATPAGTYRRSIHRSRRTTAD